MATIRPRLRKLLLLPLLLLFAYAAWPVAVAWHLRTAIKMRDIAGIENKVDWATLRANIKKTITAHLTEQANNHTSGRITKAIKGTLAPLAVDHIVDAAVTPRSLASVLAGRNLLDEVGVTGRRSGQSPSGTTQRHGGSDPTAEPDAEPKTQPEAESDADPFRPRRLRWAFFETPTRFRIEMVDPKFPGKRIISVLALQGISWRLVDVYILARA